KVSEIKLGDMTLTKDSSGKDIYTYTVKDLTPGDYTVTEKNADIEGYNLVFTKTVNGQSADKVTVTSDQTSEINLSDSYTQKPGSLTFTKSFSSNVVKEDLSNITFKVFDKNGNAVTFKDKNGKDVQEIKLGDMTQVNDSNYTYTINNLPWGTYTVRETNSSVAGYTLDTTTSHPESGNVTIDAQQLTGTVDLSDVYTPNTPDTPVTPNHPRVHLYKHEYYNGALTGNRVGGSTYALYRWKGSKASLKLFAMTTRASVAASTDPAKATRADVLNSDNWEYLGEDKTDGNGYVCSKCSGDFKELNDGDIVAAMEMTAPAGYQRTANPAIVQVHADAIPTLLADADGAVSIDKEDGGLIWRETVVRLGIKKVDANGNAVVGAKMEVLDKDGKVVDTWTTTKDNLVHEIDKLTAGETYTLRELQAPEGYEKAADVTFTAEAKDIKGTDEYVQSVTMIDQKAQPAKPGTPSNGTSVKPAQTVAQGVKTGDPTTIGGLVLMFAAAGAVLVLSAKHLKAMR
ncbi:MAG: SpaA isopeptide-forming pilin-related protein, partial [Pseudoramibacter sp.]